MPLEAFFIGARGGNGETLGWSFFTGLGFLVCLCGAADQLHAGCKQACVFGRGWNGEVSVAGLVAVK